MKWVTREKARVDRIACPWLIQRFIDPGAEFLFVPEAEVLETARREGAIPFDVPGAELGHHGDRCSFDAVMEKYRLPAIPVVDNGRDRRLEGVINMDDVLAKVIPLAWRRRHRRLAAPPPEPA